MCIRDSYKTGTVPRRVILTTGKIGVDLRKLRVERQVDDVSIVRIEQLYPLPKTEIETILESYPVGTPVYWVQEEPLNMGAWYFIKIKWDEMGLSDRWPIEVVSRPESASPSTGSKKAHKLEEQELFDEAFGGPNALQKKTTRKTAKA